MRLEVKQAVVHDFDLGLVLVDCLLGNLNLLQDLLNHFILILRLLESDSLAFLELAVLAINFNVLSSLLLHVVALYHFLNLLL